MNSYLNNLEILKNNIPSLYRMVKSVKAENDTFKIKETPSGNPTALYRGKLLHSAYDPVKEAEKIVKASADQDTAICIIEGFGLGYYAKTAIEILSDALIIVVDNSAQRFTAALMMVDLEDVLGSNRIVFLIESAANEVSYILQESPPGKISVIRNRNLFAMEAEFFNDVENSIYRFIDRKNVNDATLKKFGQIWIRNLIHNLEILPEACNIENLNEIFKNFPVLLLAAGPSLEEIIPLLKGLRKRFVIVAVDTAVRALIETGVNPDFLVVIDPQYWNIRHLDRADLSKTILISESSTHPAVFRRGHKKLFFSGSLFPLGKFMESFTGTRKRLGAGGSVSTSAWDFAHIISKGSVYCSGLDLGFPDRETHYKGSFFEERSHQESTRFNSAEFDSFRALNSANPFFEENNEGGQTLTDSRLIVYKQWFEERIEQTPDRKTFTLSKKGIKIKGIALSSMDEIENFPVIRDKIDNIISKIASPKRELIYKTGKNILKGVNTLGEELRQLSELTGKSIDAINNYNNEKSDLDSLLTLLDENDRKISALESKNISGFLIQSALKEAVLKKGNSNPLERSKTLYTEIKNSADFHLELINLYLKNYKVFSE